MTKYDKFLDKNYREISPIKKDGIGREKFFEIGGIIQRTLPLNHPGKRIKIEDVYLQAKINNIKSEN